MVANARDYAYRPYSAQTVGMGRGFYAPAGSMPYAPAGQMPYAPYPEAEPVPAPAVPVERFAAPPRIVLSLRERLGLLFLIGLVGLVLLGAVLIEAKCASIQQEINSIHAQTADIRDDIDKLYIEIEQGRRIETIEKRAKKELHMVYPLRDRMKYLDEIQYNEEEKQDLIQYIREKAYGNA
jgi:cell division protein FtsB